MNEQKENMTGCDIEKMAEATLPKNQIACGTERCRFHSKAANRGNCITKYRFEDCEQRTPDPTEKANQSLDSILEHAGDESSLTKNGR